MSQQTTWCISGTNLPRQLCVQKLQIKLSVLPRDSVPTPGQPTIALAPFRKVSSRSVSLQVTGKKRSGVVGCLMSQQHTSVCQGRVCLLVGCLTSQQQASVSQGRICSDNFTCCHTEIEVADPTFYLTQSQYTDTGPTSPSADPITTGAWQGSHWSANF